MSQAHRPQGGGGQRPTGGVTGPGPDGSPKRPEDTPKPTRLVRGNLDMGLVHLEYSLTGEPRQTILGPWRYKGHSTWFEYDNGEVVCVHSDDDPSGSDHESDYVYGPQSGRDSVSDSEP